MSATKNGEKSKRDTSIGKAEALQLLASAVNYCQQSGLAVNAGNVGGRLAIMIEGATLERMGDAVRFVIGKADNGQEAGQAVVTGTLPKETADTQPR